MKGRDNHRQTWLLMGLCFALIFGLSGGVVEAKKDKCEGTKKQRKQKMAERDLTKEQLEEMIGQLKTELLADYAQMSAGEPKHLTPGGADGKGNESWGGSVFVNNYGEIVDFDGSDIAVIIPIIGNTRTRRKP